MVMHVVAIRFLVCSFSRVPPERGIAEQRRDDGARTLIQLQNYQFVTPLTNSACSILTTAAGPTFAFRKPVFFVSN
jgi:hypothetical protein